MTQPIPDFAWYSAESARLGLKPPRCPFQNVNTCPRYFHSLSLLGEHGCTKIEKSEDDRLTLFWASHPLAPQTDEQKTGIASTEKGTCSYDNFCPEIAYNSFRVFATFLARYADEIDSELAHKQLGEEGAPSDDPRWKWASISPQHYSECPFYSQLSHDWPKALARTPPASPTASTAPAIRFDVFISHASEDKDFARPLALKLQALGLRVWFDESTMKPGDSLREEIDKGLAASDFGVAILSKHFFTKQWTLAELNGLFTLKLDGRNRIIPVWHHITKQDVANHSPMVADLLAIKSADGADSVAVQILKVVRPVAVQVFSASLSPSDQSSPRLERPHKGGRYSIELGKRHRHLREDILGINPRRMADFYGFEKVAQLEACEAGDDEFPSAAIKKLREFFFVTRDYLEEGDRHIFGSFEIISDADDCRKYLAEGFEPYLLCLNEDREQLWCWPVFHKVQDGFDRIIAAESYGYFASGGGGKSNILHLIEALQEKEVSPFSVQIQKIDRKTWNALEAKKFYCPGMERFLGPDWDAKECFGAWYEEFSALPAQYKQRANRDRAERKAEAFNCLNNLKQVGLAVHVWASEHQGCLPRDLSSMKDELGQRSTTRCPAGGKLNYDILSPGESLSDPSVVYAHCSVHNHVLLVDGSVHVLGDRHPVKKHGKWTIESP